MRQGPREVPDRIEPVVRLGRLTAWRKPDGGVRGIVVGDVLRRLVARTIAQIADQVEAATAPFQYALRTRAGSECVAHFATPYRLGPPRHYCLR